MTKFFRHFIIKYAKSAHFLSSERKIKIPVCLRRRKNTNRKILYKIGGVAAIIVGIGLSVLWIAKDPGFQAVFSDSAIIIGLIPIPGVLVGLLIQLIPTIGGVVGGIALFKYE